MTLVVTPLGLPGSHTMSDHDSSREGSPNAGRAEHASSLSNDSGEKQSKKAVTSMDSLPLRGIRRHSPVNEEGTSQYQCVSWPDVLVLVVKVGVHGDSASTRPCDLSNEGNRSVPVTFC